MLKIVLHYSIKIIVFCLQCACSRTISGLMIMASYQTFSNLAGQILHTLSIEKSLSLQKTMSVQTIFSPYYKH